MKLLGILCALAVVGMACGDDDGVSDSGVRDAARDAEEDTGSEDGGTSEDSGADAEVPPADTGTPDADDASVEDSGLLDEGRPDFGDGCEWLTGNGCDLSEWCAPSEEAADVGECREFGSRNVDETCSGETDCVDGALCVPGRDGVSRCQQACDPAMVAGEPCGTSFRCANLRGSGPDGMPVLLPLGICVPSCDFDAGIRCRDASQTCVPNEIVSSEFDLCFDDVPDLPVGGDCALAGLSRLALCGENRLCFDRDPMRPGNACRTVCRQSEGPLFGEHPDCFPGERCMTFAVGLGVCL